MNRLAKENSPYLLQHADNPVDWYPWGEEAFRKAEAENKPVFLSIGYSTCHWCHVMEKESFKDEEIARLMNDTFVSIKLDREERPDIDGIYMTICQMVTGSGGWPLTIIMTPDKKPFFAGTYFPRESRFGRPGMQEIIYNIRDIWVNKREEINRSGFEIINALKQGKTKTSSGIDVNIFERAFKELKRRFDPDYGGFGTSPKFPSPHNLTFLLRYYKRFKHKEALRMAEKTLLEMRKGGIYDHIGFGFHRYSTDKEWFVPHYEKMLYDQALLSSAYTELYQVTGDSFYQQTSEEILTYVIRDMTSPEGGFYSAEDADSEGEEGKFYLWKKRDIETLPEEDIEVISDVFNLKDEGNLPEENNADNIFYLRKTIRQIADEKNIDENLIIAKIKSVRQKLFNVRNKRIHPNKDDKILTDWNALMISAFAKAARVFNNEIFKEAAVKAAEFILKRLRDENGVLLHRYRNKEAAITACIDDYAFTMAAFIDLYESTFNIEWLRNALSLSEDLIKHFWDDENGGFFFTPDYGEKLIIRQKEIYDGAIPSGNSIAILNLLKLGRITGDITLEEKAFKLVDFFSDQINRMPSAYTAALAGLNFAYTDSIEIVIAGNKDHKAASEIIEYFGKEFIPDKIILLKDPQDKELKLISPFTEELTRIDNRTTVYICRKYSCEKPVTTLDEVKSLIN